MNIPADLKYTASHEWVRLDGDVATIGITDHAQSELGDIVFVEMPEPGRVLAHDAIFGAVESVKTVSDLYAPVAGTVIENNAALADNAEIVNADPYGAGWIVKIQVDSQAELSGLLDAAAYEAKVGESA